MKPSTPFRCRLRNCLTLRPRPISFATCVIFALALNIWAQQTVTIDWSSPNPSPVGAPSNLYGPVTLSIKVTHVNDILYAYAVNAAVSTAPTDDFANLQALLKPAAAAGGGVDPCAAFKTQLGNLEDAIQKEPNLNPTQSGSGYASISLGNSLAAWQKLAPLQSITKTMQTNPASCQATLDAQTPPAFTPVYNAIKTVDARANGPHETQPQTCVLAPGQQCSVTVYEYYIGLGQINPATPPAQLMAATTSSGKTFTITPGSGILTLSAGFMATTLGARTYSSTAVPGPTSPVLTVQNNSRVRPAAVALFNYAIPWLDSYKVGLALSAGPVIAFGGGGANVSTLGFFTGVSAHLWHRLYISPGFHFGQFADFPAGYAPGTPVPSSAGTPTATNRWTSRFAIGITFQTKDFSSIAGTSSTTAKTANAPAAPTITTPNKAGAARSE